MFGGLLRQGLAFSMAFGAAALKANAEIFLRSAMRQQSLVIHNYYDVFNRQRKIAASMEALRATRARAMMRNSAIQSANFNRLHVP